MTAPLSQLFEENRAAWDARVPIHAASAFYGLERFKAGGVSLQAIERSRVGDVRGKRLLHLQCHFGMDTLSWARLGADVVGVDFSPEAIALARSLATQLALPARFVECNVYDLRAHLKETFDVVFTSYGVIGWLPDLRPWARVIHESLAPGGRFVIVEFHPYVWMSQVGPDLSIRYSYFNRGVITEEGSGTYAERAADVKYKEHGWNHPLSDVVNALLEAGLRIDRLDEYDHAPYDCFPGLVRRGEDGNYRFKDAEGMVPMTFSLEATRPA
jgi:SAM-dependent methyltransferase